MKFLIVIVVVVALVALRLTVPPWPNFLKLSSSRQWSRKTTVALFAIALAGAAAAIVISRF
jgi:hypothetical protein